jgi:hypothetical protein
MGELAVLDAHLKAGTGQEGACADWDGDASSGGHTGSA